MNTKILSIDNSKLLQCGKKLINEGEPFSILAKSDHKHILLLREFVPYVLGNGARMAFFRSLKAAWNVGDVGGLIGLAEASNLYVVSEQESEEGFLINFARK